MGWPIKETFTFFISVVPWPGRILGNCSLFFNNDAAATILSAKDTYTH